MIPGGYLVVFLPLFLYSTALLGDNIRIGRLRGLAMSKYCSNIGDLYHLFVLVLLEMGFCVI